MKKYYIKDKIINFWANEDGMGVVEIILIIVVLVGLVIIFKEEITKIVNKIIKKMSAGIDGI